LNASGTALATNAESETSKGRQMPDFAELLDRLRGQREMQSDDEGKEGGDKEANIVDLHLKRDHIIASIISMIIEA
jgi:hypothetical protein